MAIQARKRKHMSDYARVIQHCWDKMLRGAEPNGSYFFSKADLEQSAAALGLAIKNIADIRYTFDSRERLPFSDEYGILQLGKGKYAFVPVKENLIDMPAIDEAIAVKDSTPDFAKKYLSNDEQAAMTKLMGSGCFNALPGLSCVQRLQDHWRTTCSFGQIEVDGLASAKSSGRDCILLISAKQYPGKISKTYIYNLGRLAKEKFPSEAVKILNVYCTDDCYVVWECEVGNSPDSVSITSSTAFYLY